MGLFTRKDSASKASPSRPRPSVSSEAQAAALRGRARRRLAGAVALILAAVVTLPMLLDSEPVPVSNDISIRIPDRNAPYQPQLSPQVLADAGTTGNATVGTTPETVAPVVEPPVTTAPPAAPAVTPPPVTPPPTPAVKPPPATQPPAKQPAPAPTPPKSTQRDDDGARALALLEGRAPTDTPAKPAPQPAAARGNFVLQIASYGAQADAQSRRTKLHQAGVTNAFVEQATVGGKAQYRLRVGPFPSRDAAQAAQARLRTLGYDNGFIASQ